ncbi:MAG: Cro/Cl family transcriptional regulator [Pirellulaceae bacterium]|nr:MAG: Cro/Cl family transcriptional regulator [Pirellulaceae bacterium]
MRYSFRLAQILGYDPDPRRRPGTIKAIVQQTGLDRHQVSALLKNEVKYIPLHALSRICDFLVRQGYVPADELPGALFGVEPENFWELLARRKHLALCLGVRCEDAQYPETAWVVASDSVLMGELLNGVSTLGGTAQQRYSDAKNKPHPERLLQPLVWSPGVRKREEVEQQARHVYDEFLATAGDKGLVCLGSVKSNPVAEILVAETFGCPPFANQDAVRSAADRSCPMYMRFRASDPHVESCWGGVRLAADQPTEEPGIYYELPDGSWQAALWDESTQDAAFVFYVYYEALGKLEMVLGGFSGRSTRLLAKTLAGQAQEFWPPVYAKHGVQIGAFVVRYTLANRQPQASDILRTDWSAQTEVIRLSGDVIARKLKPSQQWDVAEASV